MAEEKIITINLRKEIKKTPKWKRSKSALKILRERIEKIAKTEVKIDSSQIRRFGLGELKTRLQN